MKTIFLSFTLLLASFLASQAQNTFPSTGAVGIGTTSPAASSLLEVRSTAKGVLFPRMTQTQRNAIANPATGLLIYQTDKTAGFYVYTGSTWKAVSPAGVNKTLSNLTGPTAVNASLIPDSTGKYDLGTTSIGWRNGYFDGTVGAKGIGSSTGIYGQSSSGYGVYGSSSYIGVYGTGDSYGVYGYSGSSYGVVGSGGYAGLYGSGNTYGVYGTSSGSYGVYGNSSTSHGVYGNSSSGGYGVYGKSNYLGVFGTGGTYGVYGQTTSGEGVYGQSGYVGLYGLGGTWGAFAQGTTYGVEGYSTTTGAFGIYGYSVNGNGVYGATGNGGYYAGYFGGSVYATGTYQGSDMRAKQNIRDFGSAMDIIKKLHPKQYEFRTDGNFKAMNFERGTHFGLIAQDLEKVLPNLVKTSPVVVPTQKTPDERENAVTNKTVMSDFKAVNYTELIPIMIKGMQELSDENEALKNELAELKQLIKQGIASNAVSGTLSSAVMSQNFPNPFNKSTTIAFNIPKEAGSANIVVSQTATGKIINKIPVSGSSQVAVDAATLSSGTYTYTLYIDGKKIDSKQMIITR